jgi:hypothetical protein
MHRPLPAPQMRLPLLPVGERPRSLNPSPSKQAPEPSRALPLTAAEARHPHITGAESAAETPDAPLSPAAYEAFIALPRAGEASRRSSALNPRTLFARPRAGSIPNPITVVRDSRDNAYNITIAADTEEVPDSSALTNGSAAAASGSGRQQFPQTPDAFSPMWSPGVSPSPGAVPSMILFGSGANGEPGVILGGPDGDLVIPAPLMRSASVAGPAAVAAIRAKLSALGRSATLHKVPSLGALASQVTGISPGPSPARSADARKAEVLSPVEERDASPELESRPGPSVQVAAATPLPESENKRFSANVERLPDALRVEAEEHRASSSRSSSPASSLRLKRLPPTPEPSRPSSRGVSPSRPLPIVGPSREPSPRPKPLPLPEASAAARITSPPRPPTSQSSRSIPLPSPPSPVPEARPRPRGRNPPSQPDSLFGEIMRDSTFVAPPAYHTVVNEQPPRASSDFTERPTGFSTPASPPESASSRRPSESSSGPGTPDLSSSHGSLNRRTRARPVAVPIGPRRPSASATPAHSRNRNASVSSINSTSTATGPTSAAMSAFGTPHNISRQVPLPTAGGPKFQAPTIPWRGFTLDVAKWTFTSQQLQAVVSRAIRQSAEASSLRLVPLEILDTEAPEETARLEMRGSEVKLEYKMLVRKRSALLTALTAHAEGTQLLDAPSLQRTLSELADNENILDGLSDELYGIQDQIRQLAQLRDVHAYSALAMALRKLNASFLKQVSENQERAREVARLESERDDAWTQAQELAQQLHELREAAERAPVKHEPTPSPEVLKRKLDDASSSDLVPVPSDIHDPGPSISARSSRVPVSRKSSTRVSRSFRASMRRSVRSSTSSNGMYSSTRSTFSDAVPPVPPIPRRNPLAVRTSDLQSRLSYGRLRSKLFCGMFLILSQLYHRMVRRLQRSKRWQKLSRSCTLCWVSRHRARSTILAHVHAHVLSASLHHQQLVHLLSPSGQVPLIANVLRPFLPLLAISASSTTPWMTT